MQREEINNAHNTTLLGKIEIEFQQPIFRKKLGHFFKGKSDIVWYIKRTGFLQNLGLRTLIKVCGKIEIVLHAKKNFFVC